MPEILPLTALRGWLALWVVLFHLSPLVPPSLLPLTRVGDVAVDVFFLLSGFVIALSYAQRLEHSAQAYARFLWARWARIYPVHAAHQLAWLLLLTAAAAFGRAGITWTQLDPLGFARALLLVHAWSVPMQMTWNYPSWSVSLEWLAYLAAPLLLLLPRLAGRVRGGLLALSSVLWLLSLAAHAQPWEHLVRIASEFTAGACLAAWHREGRAALVSFARLRWLFVAGFVLLLVLTSAAQRHALVMPLAAAGLLGFAQTTRASAWQVYCGRISYSLYISHALAITLLHQLVPARPHAPLLAAYVLGIYVLGAASYHLIECPARRRLMGLREVRARVPLVPARTAARAEPG